MSQPNRRIGILWQPEWDGRLVVAWLAGKPLTEIGRELGCCPKAVDRSRRRIGLPPRVNFSTWTPERDATLRELLEKGFSAAVIGKELGVSRCAVLGRSFRLGLCAPHGTKQRIPRIKARESKLNTEFRAQFSALWADMIRADEIGKILGIATKTVFNYAARMGLKRQRVVTTRSASSRRTAPGLSAIPSTPAALALPDPNYADCLTLEQLSGTCHWPLGEPTKFCPRKACELGHGSYCEQHYARSVSSPTRKTVIRPFRRAA
jgi:hypothetical protein